MKDFNIIDKQKKIKSYLILSISFLIMLFLILGINYVRQNKDEPSSSSSDAISSSIDEISSSIIDEASSSSTEAITELNQIERYISNSFKYYNIEDVITNKFIKNEKDISSIENNVCDKNDKLIINNLGQLEYFGANLTSVEQPNTFCSESIISLINISKKIKEKINSFVIAHSDEGESIIRFYLATDKSIYEISENKTPLKAIYNENTNRKILKIYLILNPDNPDCIYYQQTGIIFENEKENYILDKNLESTQIEYKIIPLNTYFQKQSVIARSDNCGGNIESFPSLGININEVLLINREEENNKFVDPITKKELKVKELFSFNDSWLIISSDNNIYLFYELGYVNFGQYKKFEYKLISYENESREYFKSLSIELNNGQKFEYVK